MGEDLRNPNDYNVKEILSLFVLPALADLKKTQTEQNEHNEERFNKLEAAKNRVSGALVLIVAVLIPLSVPVIGLMLR